VAIFSVNLRRALDLAPTNETEAGAKVLTEPLEFSCLAERRMLL
jgi:hypothetical protein